MVNRKNLMPISEVNSKRSRAQHSADSRKGGKKSGEARRRKKTLKELMERFGALDLPPSEMREELLKAGVPSEELSNDMALVIGQYLAAIKGNPTAAAFVRDTKGEKPKEVVENHNIEYKPLVDLTKRKKNGAEK